MIDNNSSGAAGSTDRARPTRDGFALPLAILVMAFLTVTIAAAYAATSSEVVTNNAQRGESRASMLAQAGLEHFMARRNEVGFCAQCGLPPTVTYESTTVTFPGGFARVVAQRVRTATKTRPAIYLLRSHGFDTANVVMAKNVTSGAVVQTTSERLVGQLVYWNVNQVNVLSGWTATNGLNKQGSSGTISGNDACSAIQGGGMPPVAGIAVPTGDFSVNGNFTPEGSPAVKEIPPADLEATVKVDWDGIINGNRIQADYTFANNAAAQAGWPAATFAANANFFPVIRVNGNFTLPSSGGRGTLIVMGNLTMDGNNLWNGILLVGGQMTSNGNGTVQGATMSGLNVLLSPTELAKANTLSSSVLSATPPPATANGTKTFQYNSCDVAKAAGGLASYSVYPNAWMDNLVTY